MLRLHHSISPFLSFRSVVLATVVACVIVAVAGCSLMRGPLPPSAAPLTAPPALQTSIVESAPEATPLTATVVAEIAVAPKATLPTLTPHPIDTTTVVVENSSLATATTPISLAVQSAIEPPGVSAPVSETIGASSRGYPLVAYRFGQGERRVALIGGIHGGYEWNTILLAYEMIDYLAQHPEAIPVSLTVYVVPSANPDGQKLVVGAVGRFAPGQVAAETRPGRLNGNGVDLNRNWECHWSPTGLWGQTEVSGGKLPFSEPETNSLKRFLTEPVMDVVVFWHSAASGVFAGGCDTPFLPAVELGQVYAHAASYPFQAAFTNYAVTGDATDWLSLQGIPAITVELNNHTDLDWEQNLAGTLALLSFLAGGP